jgi:hypothetical protein
MCTTLPFLGKSWKSVMPALPPPHCITNYLRVSKFMVKIGSCRACMMSAASNSIFRGFCVRVVNLKISLLAAVAVAILAITPVASATSLNLVYNGATVGTVSLTQNGSNVDATISMNSGFAIAVQGPTLAFTGGLTNTSTLTNFSLNGVSVSGNACGGFNQFSFTICFQTTGGT